MPEEARFAINAVQAFAEVNIPTSVGPTKHACLVAMAMGAWVNGQHKHRAMNLSAWDMASIQTVYKNSARIVGDDVYLLFPVIAAMFDRGMMPPGAENPFV